MAKLWLGKVVALFRIIPKRGRASLTRPLANVRYYFLPQDFTRLKMFGGIVLVVKVTCCTANIKLSKGLSKLCFIGM